ncbi:hypothetical protein BDQ12DRAFT_666930 [Crucibulum laeve]|uniref:Uncharacterized protein n=1 Tax=Crucibulum laeve TaxID=68775 RepID=A0A5C3LYC4_9AGAR|nr:hypothetical protein BDQ12DRAFT_666930 [Crucibulum laeve]
MPNTLIDLAPSPGFCIKTATLQPAVYTPTPTQSPSPNNNILEQPQHPIPIPKGRKVFVNIAWDKNVPPPPEGSEEAIQNAMKGEDVDETNEQGWFVPVVVSEGREDVDKCLGAGSPLAMTWDRGAQPQLGGDGFDICPRLPLL